MDWIHIEGESMINARRIVAVGPAASAPIRRLLQATPVSHVVVLTGGRKRQTALVLDSGHVVITSLTTAELAALLAAF